MEFKVHSILEIHFNINHETAPKLTLYATGGVNTSGWHSGNLIPWTYQKQPEDGIQDFDLVASPPEGKVMNVLSSVEALIIVQKQNWMKGARVHSSSNTKEILLEDKSYQAQAYNADLEIWPWPWEQK